MQQDRVGTTLSFIVKHLAETCGYDLSTYSGYSLNAGLRGHGG